MAFQFTKHFTIQEARGLLPRIKEWLSQIDQLRHRLKHFEQRLGSMVGGGGDVGGEAVNEWVKTVARYQEMTFEFQKRQIQIKDIERGLIDFPALLDGREVFLCWEKDEDDIEFWHDVDSGFAGRERLE